jgi:hypothetical protein
MEVPYIHIQITGKNFQSVFSCVWLLDTLYIFNVVFSVFLLGCRGSFCWGGGARESLFSLHYECSLKFPLSVVLFVCGLTIYSPRESRKKSLLIFLLSQIWIFKHSEYKWIYTSTSSRVGDSFKGQLCKMKTNLQSAKQLALHGYTQLLVLANEIAIIGLYT